MLRTCQRTLWYSKATGREWSSGLRLFDQNWKVPGSNSTRHSARLKAKACGKAFGKAPDHLWIKIKMHCSHHTDLLLFTLNLDFDLFVSTRKYVSPDFWRKLFKRSPFNILFLGFLVGERKKGRYGGSSLGANYNSANNTQKKGVSWYNCSSKIGKIPEKYTWRSSS